MQAMTFDKDDMIFFLGQLQGWTGQRNLESMIVSKRFVPRSLRNPDICKAVSLSCPSTGFSPFKAYSI